MLATTVPASAPPGPAVVEGTGESSGRSAHGTFTVRTDWPSSRFSPDNAGLNPYENQVSAVNVGNLALAWAAAVDTYPTAGPVVADNAVFVGTQSAVYAFNATTGAEIWTHHLGSLTSTSTGLAVAHGLVYVSEVLDHRFYALDARTGSTVWSIATLGGTTCPKVVGKVAYFCSNDAKLHAVNALTGDVIWTVQLRDAAFSPPAVVDGVVYVGADDRRVYALDAATGAILWTHQTVVAVGSSPAVVGGIVYVGSGDYSGSPGAVYALRAATGGILWKVRTVQGSLSSPAVARGLVFIASGDGLLHAYDAATGATRWSTAVGGDVDLASPSVANGDRVLRRSGRQRLRLRTGHGEGSVVLRDRRALQHRPSHLRRCGLLRFLRRPPVRLPAAQLT